MHVDDQVPILVGEVLEADITKNAGIVDEDIDAAVGLNGGFDDLVAIGYAVVVGYSFAARGYDLIDDYICGLQTMSVVSSMRDGMCIYLC